MFKRMFLIVLVALVCQGAAIANLVQNGDFESATPFEHWFYDDATEVADNGPSAPGVKCPDLDETIDGAAQLRSVAIPVEWDTTYTLSFDYKTTAESVDWFWTQIRWWTDADEHGNTSGTWLGESNVVFENTGGVWLVHSRDVTSPTGANYADIIFNAGVFSANFAGHVRADNVSLVPEPATLAILGLGGLLTLRRRKA